MIAAGRLQPNSAEDIGIEAPTGSVGAVRRLLPRLGRAAVTFGGLILAWEAAVRIFRPQPWIVPAPSSVFITLVEQRVYLGENALVTFSEIGIGLLLGAVCGSIVALMLIASAGARRWLLPLVVASQALPVFAIAPLLVIWLGYGLASKIAMATLIIFFPVASAFFDGLRRTDPALLDLAKLQRAGKLATLRLIRVPAALPGLASGLRVAAAAAPIGAVVGEWVGASAGLGYVMLHANARMQTDLVFAALAVLGVTAALLWFAVDAVLARLLPWSAERG